MAIGCLANWLRNRSFHCAITGPLFLIGGVMFLLSGVRTIHVNTLRHDKELRRWIHHTRLDCGDPALPVCP